MNYKLRPGSQIGWKMIPLPLQSKNSYFKSLGSWWIRWSSRRRIASRRSMSWSRWPASRPSLSPRMAGSAQLGKSRLHWVDLRNKLYMHVDSRWFDKSTICGGEMSMDESSTKGLNFLMQSLFVDQAFALWYPRICHEIVATFTLRNAKVGSKLLGIVTSRDVDFIPDRRKLLARKIEQFRRLFRQADLGSIYFSGEWIKLKHSERFARIKLTRSLSSFCII